MQWRIVVKDGIIVEVTVIVGVEVVVLYSLPAATRYRFKKTVSRGDFQQSLLHSTP